MSFTMHSHSGQFCPGHAKDQLEDIILHAIAIGYKTMGLTEHMPRYEERDLYPEERGNKQESLAQIAHLFSLYFEEAKRLQAKYANKIHILIGFEAEFIRPSFAPLVLDLARPAYVDYFIGSVHHVYSIPIDYDKETYQRAVIQAGSQESASREEAAVSGAEERLWEDYYDLQLEMLRALKPKIVGHIDLIRLLSETPGKDPREWKGVWERIMRNLEVVREQGGWLECNSAALRKGLAEPYPCRPIAEQWIKMGGKFTLSDDSHGIAQVATNYERAISYLKGLGVGEVWTWERKTHPGTADDKKAELEEVSISL